MNAPLAQIIALACHANEAFRDRRSPRFFPDNSTCRFCDRVSFGRPRRRFSFLPTGKSVESPDKWLETLAHAGAIGARLHWVRSSRSLTSDRMTAGLVGGGGSWRVETFTAASESLFWVACWHVWNQQAADQRIWRVHYSTVKAGATRSGEAIDVGTVTAGLRLALVDMRDFSRHHQECGPFTALFDRALESLTTGKRSGYHQDLAPPGILSEAEARILDACQSAYVFGAMGSWNDMSFDQPVQTEYERISNRAFDTIHASIVAAVNGWAARRWGRTGVRPGSDLT